MLSPQQQASAHAAKRSQAAQRPVTALPAAAAPAVSTGRAFQCSVREGSSLRGPLSSDRPVLYTHTCCPYAERALLALLEKVCCTTSR